MVERIPQAARLLVVLAAALAAVAFAPRDAVALDLPAGFSTVEVAAGLDGPTALAYAPDGRLFVAEKAGRVRVVDADGRLQPDPVIDISGHVNSYWDRGLLSIAVDPQFATNHYLYLLYVNETNAIDPTAAKTSRLTRIQVTADNGVVNPGAPETVLLGTASQVPCPPPGDFVDCLPADGFSHSIGTVRADPDGTLWLGSGDASGFWGADPKAVRTYNENSLAGKIIHVGRDGRGLAGHPFCPAETDLDKVCTKLYAKGFRNPFRFQLGTGQGPLVGDVGWNTTEELDVAQPGRSYGWPCYEGSARTASYQDLASCVAQYDAGPGAHQAPAYEYPHAGSDAAIMAGPRYEADQYPAAYRGAWFFADYAKGLIWHMTLDAEGHVSGVAQFASSFGGGVDLERAPSGDLVYVNFGGDAGTGSIQRIVYGNRPPVAHATASPSSGVAPLAVTLGSAGSSDPDGEALTYEWDFDSDGSADATGPSLAHTYPSGSHTATLTVRDTRGLADSDTVAVLADESPPTATLLAPAAGSRYRIGRPIVLEGAGTDAQDGTLGDASLHWRITIHHGGHTHVVEADHTGHRISFTPPGDHDADAYLEFRLTAKDSAGLTSSKVRTMQPETIQLKLESAPPGARLSYGGLELTAPTQRTAAIGFHTTVSAPAELMRGGVRFAFDRWSDGGARLHDIVVPDHDTTLTAGYRDVSTPVSEGGVLGVDDSSRVPRVAPRIQLDSRVLPASTRRLRGRVLRASGRPRVDVALRSLRNAAGCRWWRRALGRRDVRPSRCDRPVWMSAIVSRSGRLRVELRGRPRRGRYVVLMRARTRAVPSRVIVRSSTGVRFR
jgi:glucose/arabinose dehydrogenase